MKRKLFITTSILILSIIMLHAQSWQWGRNGGGTAGTALNPEDNSILDIKHDNGGNVFILGGLSRFTARFMGDTFNINGNDDLVLYKLDCNGNDLWHKQIGDMTSLDYAGAYIPSISIDNNDNVYVVGYAAPSSTHGFKVDTDTLFTPTIGQVFRSYIVKYDKNGNYKSFKTNETYNVSNQILYSRSYMGNDNYLYILSGMAGNVLSRPDTVNFQYYILKYDTNLVLQNKYPISDSGIVNNWSIAGDGKENIYLAGFTVSVGPDTKITILGGHQVPVTKSFICKFDKTGTFKWITMNDDSQGTSIHACKYDKNIGVVCAGNGGGTYSPGDTGTRFGSVRIINPSRDIAGPIVIVFDTLGNCIRGVGMGSRNISYSTDVAISNLGHILISGVSAGPKFNFLIDSISTNLQDAFFVELTSDLNVIQGHVLNGSGFYDAITKVTYDGRGNIYAGGYMGGNMNIPSDTLRKVGGAVSDLFITKYGVPACLCPYAVSNYTDAYTSSLNYTYTSSAINADTIWWDFGDGNTQSGGTTANHTYATAGNYTVCQHVSNDCSVDEFCKNISVVTDITEIKDTKESYSAIIYPNPATSSVHIHIQGGDLPVNCEYILFDVAGKQVLTGKITGKDTAITLPSSITDGVYFLKINNEKGAMLLSKQIEIAR